MAGMFQKATTFNGTISTWNVASVSDMQSMFYYARSFAQDISGWNVKRTAALAGRAIPSPLCVVCL
jgi:hypothetical protein